MTCGQLPKKAIRRSPAARGHLIEESGGAADKKGCSGRGAVSAPGPGSTPARGPAGNSGKTGEDLESGRQGTT